MDQSERSAGFAMSFVSGVKAVQHVDKYRGGHVDGQWRAPFSGKPTYAGQGFALDVVHDDEQLALQRDYVQGGYNIRVTDARGQTGLVEEHGYEFRVLGKLRMQSLDRHGARKAGRPQQSSQVYGGHAPGRNLSK